MHRSPLAFASLVAGALVAFGSLAQAQNVGDDGPIAPLLPAVQPLSPPSETAPSGNDTVPVREKSPFAALAWELLPGGGSLYAGDVPGAITTWVLIVGGTAAAIGGFSMISFPDADTSEAHHSSSLAMPLLLGGLGLAIYGRIHGFVSAYAATERYNAALGQGSGLSLSFAPIVTSNGDPGFVLGGRF